jgi:Uma2 family endonuclease
MARSGMFGEKGMETASKTTFLSLGDYLSSEELSPRRREYVSGYIYTVPENTTTHNEIAGNLIARLHGHLRGKPCRLFAFEIKVHFFAPAQEIIYYPDLMVACDPREKESHVIRYPKIVIEVLSGETERIDRHEKFWNYTQIETLQEYVLVAQDKMEVTIFRRAQDWKAEIANRAEQEIRLDSVKFTMQAGAIYEGVPV